MAAALQILSIISHQVALFDNVDLHLDRLELMLNIRNDICDEHEQQRQRLQCLRKTFVQANVSSFTSIELKVCRRNFIKNSLNSSKHSTGSNRITNVGAERSGGLRFFAPKLGSAADIIVNESVACSRRSNPFRTSSNMCDDI